MKLLVIPICIPFLITGALAQTQIQQDYLQIFIVEPPKPLDWTNPKKLLETTAANASFIDKAPEGHFAPRLDYAPNGHFVVHFVYANRSEGAIEVLTGMSRANKTKTAEDTLMKGYGLTAMLKTFPGELDAAKGDLKELDEAVRARRLSSLVFPLNSSQAKKINDFLNLWINYGVYHNYGGAKDVGKGEGAGCADFAMYLAALATDGVAPLESWIRRELLPNNLMLRSEPKAHGTQSAVSIGKMMYSKYAEAWALDEAHGFEFITPDPELVSAWILTKNQTRIVSFEPSVDDGPSSQGKKILSSSFDRGGKTQSDEITVYNMWDRITVSASDHEGHSFLESPL